MGPELPHGRRFSPFLWVLGFKVGILFGLGARLGRGSLFRFSRLGEHFLCISLIPDVAGLAAKGMILLGATRLAGIASSAPDQMTVV